MSPKRIFKIFGPWFMALGFFTCPAQELRAQVTFPRDTLLAVAREIMDAARYCGMVTLDESGTFRVRTMDPFAPEEDMTIWMGTNRRTRKVQEINRNPRVSLYYQSPDAVGYVTITGRARLVDDAEEKASRWKDEWEAFYQDRASEYLLIHVTPERLEVVDYSRGIVGDPETWAPPFVEFQEPTLLTAPAEGPGLWGALRIPRGPGPHPAAILLHGSSGWRPEYLEIADRFAEAGFATLVLDYYAGTGGAPIGSDEKLQKWDSWRRTVQEACEFLRDLPSVDGDRIALVGYSRGAFLAVSVAASIPSVRAVVDYFGGGGGGTRTLEQEVLGLPPLLILHGEQDSVVPVSFAEALRAAAVAAGGQVEAHLFPDDGHAFNAPWSDTYSRESDEESFALTIAFLRSRLQNL